MLAFGAFVKKIADILRDDPQHRRLERAFDVVNRLHAGVEILNKEGEADAHEQTKHQAKTDVDGLVWFDRRLAGFGGVGNLHHGIFR